MADQAGVAALFSLVATGCQIFLQCDSRLRSLGKAQFFRNFELKDDELSYRVVPRPNGDVPISVWQRLK
jgi:hypothetical protein